MWSLYPSSELLLLPDLLLDLLPLDLDLLLLHDLLLDLDLSLLSLEKLLLLLLTLLEMLLDLDTTVLLISDLYSSVTEEDLWSLFTESSFMSGELLLLFMGDMALLFQSNTETKSLTEINVMVLMRMIVCDIHTLNIRKDNNSIFC